jgi:hypothetical protein
LASYKYSSKNKKFLVKLSRKKFLENNYLEGVNMFQVSEKATEMLKENFKDRDTLPTIRLYLAPGG